jgi:hypothetical protein
MRDCARPRLHNAAGLRKSPAAANTAVVVAPIKRAGRIEADRFAQSATRSA